MKISDLIGETTEYDKKQAVEERKPKSWCKSVSAFANGKDGSLIFGVADDDTIIGLADLGKIIDTYENAHNFAPGMEPTFFSNRAQFTVTLKNLNISVSEANPEANDESNLKLILIQEIIRDPQITQQVLADRLHISRSSIQRMMKVLTEEGTLERIGGTRGYWKIKE